MNEILWFAVIMGLLVVFFVSVYLLLRAEGDDGKILSGGGPLGELYDRYQRHQITIDQYLDRRKEVQEQIPENTVETVSRYL